jgi:hypothetical protein
MTTPGRGCGFDRMVPLAVHAEVRQLTPEERAPFNTG